jgi:drug/metabolite transporter (DMT)-like permease
MTPSAPITGMLLSAVAFLFFTAFDVVSKFLAGRYSVFQIMSVEFVTAGLLITGYAFWRDWNSPDRTALRIAKPHLHLMRGGFQIFGQSLAYLAIPHLTLAEFYVIVFCMPAVTVLKAGWFLKERAAAHIWPVLAVNFIGVLIAVRPDRGLNFWALVAFAGIVLLAGGLVVLRRMSESETAEMTGITTAASLALGALVVTPFVYKPMELNDFALAVLGGALFAPAQMLLVAAFRMAPVALASPPQFLQLAYGAAAGYVVFGDVPTLAVCIGGGIVIAANAVLIYVENGKAPRKVARKDGETLPAGR